jgi:hypothetical protein
VVYTLQIGKNKIKLLTEYENVIQKVVYKKDVLAANLSLRKYDVISQNDDCSEEINLHTLVLRNRVRYQNATSLQNSVWKTFTFR